MKHELTPVTGARYCNPPRAGLRRLAHLACLGFAALAASPAFAQVFVSIDVADDRAAESPADNGQFVVRRVGGDFFRPVRVSLSLSGSATEGADYSPLPDSVTLTFGQPSILIDVAVPGNDGVFEGDETVTITLLEEDGDDVVVANGTATLTILDSAHSVTAEARAHAVEASADGEILVALGARNESGATLTIDYSVAGTAEPGTDYEALAGSVGIPHGESAATIVVHPLDDDLFESDKSVEIALTATSDARVPVGSPASASVTISDDEVARDDDGDGLANGDECPDFAACRDTDADALPDYLDPDDDGDGVPTASENAPGQDTDDDGIADFLDPDDDGDGRPTRDEDTNADGDGNPATSPLDADGDSVPDYLDADDGGGPEGDPDGDGLTNAEEEDLGTDPRDPDSDADGVNDGDENAAGTNPLDGRSFADSDGDLVPDAVEAAEGSSPDDPADFADADGGGTADHVETVTYPSFGLPPTDPANAADDVRDSDGDGLPDRFELALASAPDSSDSPTANGSGDDDGNGVSNAVQEYLGGLGITAVGRVSDFDRDGYPDAVEVSLGLDPLSSRAPDVDGDGVPNVVEALVGVDASASTDRDGDGVPDAREIALGSDPLDANSPVANGATDEDGDGVSLAIEHVLASLGATGDITADSDADADGIADADELRLGADPFRAAQPVPWIELVQADFGPVRALAAGGGQATARARIGGHQPGLVFDWSGTDPALLAVSSGPQNAAELSFAPATLPPGAYDLAVEVSRRVGDVTTPASLVRFTIEVLADAPASMLADGDNDGVPDAADGTDGRRGSANVLPSNAIAPILAEAGTRLQLGAIARTAQNDSALVSAADISGAGGSEDEFEYIGGIYDFEVTNLAEPGAVARIVIPQASPIGNAPQYRKFRTDAGWADFVEDDSNAIASAPGQDNECPPPGDDAYQPGLTSGHLCVQLSIEDGGPNDGDAADGPNGVVRDPGGVGTPEGEVVVGQGSGAASPWALLLLVLAAACRYRRRPPATRRSPPATRWSPPATRWSPPLRATGMEPTEAPLAPSFSASASEPSPNLSPVARRWRAPTLPSPGSCRAFLPVVVAGCLAAAIPAARADVFLGGGVGMSRLTPDTGNTPFSVSDNGDYGYKVFGGFDLTPLSPNLSVEGFWADLGETALGNVGTLEYSVYGAGLLYGIGSVKAPRVSGYLELGVTRLEIDGDVVFEQEESTSLFFGVAGSFAVGRHLFLQLEYEYFAEDAQFISLSLVKRFRTSGDARDDDVRTIPLPDRPGL